MKIHFCLLLFALLLPIKSHSQYRDICVMLHLEDSDTKRQLGNGLAYAFSKNKEGVDTLTMIKIMKATPEYMYYGELKRKLSVGDTLFVRSRCENYEEETTPFVITQKMIEETPVNIEGTVRLRRAPKTLREATVTASKIMMVNKGDTIVYNADYFQLAEGSMLDALISQLPGVKLEKGGRITINGNFVSSLLINGKDFFKGDPTVALENLPAYMVNKVKAYQKAPDNAYIIRDSLKANASDPWVIDVNLKRDYAQGWIANAESGYGTGNRYLARLFGLRFTDYSRLSLFTNFNNTNDNGRPGREGSWSSIEPVFGRSVSKTGGLSYGTESKNHKTSFSTNLTLAYNNDDIQTEKSTERFQAFGSSYVRSRNQEHLRNTVLNMDASFSHSAKKAYFCWDNVFSYNHSKDAANNYSVESAALPTESYRGALLDSLFVLQNYAKAGALTNYNRDLSTQSTTNWTYISLFNADIRLPHSHYITLQLNGRYSHATDKWFSRYALFMPRSSENGDYRNKYQTTPQHEYQWWAYANAPIYEKNIVRLVAAYTYRQEYYSNSRNLYRLDYLGGQWASANGYALGMLPSTGDSLTRCIDYANTFNSNRHLYRHTPELQVQLTFKKGAALTLLFPVNFEHDVLSDLRMKDVRSRVSKHYVGFDPKIQFSWSGLNIEAHKRLVAPDMTYLLDVRDDSSPLAIYLGNPTLKATDIYSLSTKFSKTITKHAQNYYIGAGYHVLHHAVGQSRLYDNTLGVTTYTPRNINGNWTVSINGGYARSLDARQYWTISADAVWKYDNSVDFLQTNNIDAVTRTSVHNQALDGNLALRYRQKAVALSFVTSAKWQHAESEREGFTTINSLDMLYGLTANVTFPWGITLNTDCSLYTRGGYSDETMNTHEWIWNAELSKSFLRKKSLVIRLLGYDLLHQRHNVLRTLNAQGRTETWYNTIPRYVMLTLAYRLSIQPKKANQ